MSEHTLMLENGLIYGPEHARGDYKSVLQWLIVTVALILGVLFLWSLGLVQQVLATDHTYMSVLIAVVFVVASVHCLLQCWSISRQQIAAREVGALLQDGAVLSVADDRVLAGDRPLPGGSLTRHIGNLVRKARLQGGGRIDQELLLRDLADELHQRGRLGLFVSEALLRLALLGTAIGFILMLVPISAITGFEADVLREALSGMSAGMAIALNVTVLGIATALILKLECFFLDQAIAQLFSTTIKVTEISVLPVLQRSADATR